VIRALEVPIPPALMDGYVNKPVKIELLFAETDRAMGVRLT
jgi:hypothetical protein